MVWSCSVLCQQVSLNWCCQSLLCYPALMVNFLWFTDDKLFKFHHCRPNKFPKRSCSRACRDSLTFTPSSKTVHQHTQRSWDEFLARKTRDFIGPELLHTDTMNSFSSVNYYEVHHRKGNVSATAGTNQDEQACCHNTRHRYVTTSKEYLINSRILFRCFKLILSATAAKISCKFVVIRLSLGRNNNGAFYWNTVYREYCLTFSFPWENWSFSDNILSRKLFRLYFFKCCGNIFAALERSSLLVADIPCLIKSKLLKPLYLWISAEVCVIFCAM